MLMREIMRAPGNFALPTPRGAREERPGKKDRSFFPPCLSLRWGDDRPWKQGCALPFSTMLILRCGNSDDKQIIRNQIKWQWSKSLVKYGRHLKSLSYNSSFCSSYSWSSLGLRHSCFFAKKVNFQMYFLRNSSNSMPLLKLLPLKPQWWLFLTF